jgi:ribonuclease BN (tRNA processing enzyme)
VVVSECTFFEDEHRDRARIGKHLHIEDFRSLFEAWSAQDIVIVHVSRRTLMPFARTRIEEVVGVERAARVHLLMDHRTNRARHEALMAAAGESGRDAPVPAGDATEGAEGSEK